MASYVASLFIALIAGLACQMTIGREWNQETSSEEEAASMESEYVDSEEEDVEKWLDESEEEYDMGYMQRNHKVSNVGLVSKYFDTSPWTLNKFTGENSNPNEDNRHVTGVTDKNSCKKDTRKITFTKEFPIMDEEDFKSSVNSSMEINSVDTEELSTPNPVKPAARLFRPSMPSDAEDTMEQGKMNYYPNSRRTIPPMFANLYKELVPYMADVPDVIESMETKAMLGNGLLLEPTETDTITSNVEKQITSGSENKDWSLRGDSLLESLATLNFENSQNVNKKTMTITIDNTVNTNDGEPNFPTVRAAQAPQSRMFADDTENEMEDGDEREIQKNLKKGNERWIKIIINHYPPARM